MSLEEIVLDGDNSERLENVNLQHDSPPSTGCGENGSIIAGEKKASYLSISFLNFLVAIYPGFIAIFYLYFVLYLKPRKYKACGQSNICDSTAENFGLLHIRYNDNEIYLATYMLDEKLPACLEAKINQFKVATKLYNGKKVTRNCRTLLEDSEDGDISNSGLTTSEDSDGKLIDESISLIRRKTMKNYNVQIDYFTISDDHSHSETYIGDLPVNDFHFMNISSSVNEMPYNYEESKLTDFFSKTEGHCQLQLKADCNIMKENPVTAKSCSKAPIECFGTSGHGCSKLNMSFEIKSSSEKTDLSTSSSDGSVHNDDKFSYNHTSWTGGVTGKNHKENNKIQNGEDIKGDGCFHDRRNVTNLLVNCLPRVGLVDGAPFQGGNDENDESNYSPEKQGISCETSTVDDPKLGKILTLTTDSIHCQNHNCSPLTDISSVVYGDFEIHANSRNPNTPNEYPIELAGKCENKSNSITEVSSQILQSESGSHHALDSNSITEVSSQILQSESGSHHALNNTLSKHSNDREKLPDICVVKCVGWEMKIGTCYVPCCSVKMQKVCSEISHDNNISALTTDCNISSDEDSSSEIDNSDRNHCPSKDSSSILCETCDKLRDPHLCMAIVDLSNYYRDCGITHNSSERASSKCKKSEDTKFPQFYYNNVTGRIGISRDRCYILISITEKFLDGLKRESEVHNSVIDKSKEMPDMLSIYLKRENQRHKRNTVKIQGCTKLGFISVPVDGAKVHGKMLTYQR